MRRSAFVLACAGLACALAADGARALDATHRHHRRPPCAPCAAAPCPPCKPERHERRGELSFAQRYEWEIWVSGALLLGAFVQGVAGFGLGMTAMAIVPAKLPIMDAVPIVALFSFVACAVLVLQLRGSLGSARVRAAFPALLAGAAVGVPIGVGLLNAADPRLLRCALGGSMLAFALERLAHGSTAAVAPRKAPYGPLPTASPPGAEAAAEATFDGAALEATAGAELLLPGSAGGEERPPRRTAGRALLGFAVGLSSGGLGGALNEAGPPVVAYFAVQGWRNDEVKGALSFYFMCVSALSLALLCQRGLLGALHMHYAAAGLPPAALGLGLGVLVYERLDQRLFGHVVVGALLLAGVAYIASAGGELLAEHAADRGSTSSGVLRAERAPG